MGYRSDVGFCFKRPPELVIPLSIDGVEKIFDWDEILHNDEAMLFYISSIKWYEDSKSVQKVMEFLDTLNEDDYLFIRLGENDEDIETFGGWWGNPFCLGYTRKITFDTPS